MRLIGTPFRFTSRSRIHFYRFCVWLARIESCENMRPSFGCAFLRNPATETCLAFLWTCILFTRASTSTSQTQRITEAPILETYWDSSYLIPSARRLAKCRLQGGLAEDDALGSLELDLLASVPMADGGPKVSVINIAFADYDLDRFAF